MFTSAVFNPWEAELLSANAGIDMVVIAVIIDAKVATIASAFRYII
jgi:hypothetical protein